VIHHDFPSVEPNTSEESEYFVYIKHLLDLFSFYLLQPFVHAPPSSTSTVPTTLAHQSPRFTTLISNHKIPSNSAIMKPMLGLVALLAAISTVSAFPWFGSTRAIPSRDLEDLEARDIGETNGQCNLRVCLSFFLLKS